MTDFIPYGKVHQVQLNDYELWAIEPLLIDAIYDADRRISDIRKTISTYTPEESSVLLVEIQQLEGKKVVFNSLAEQLNLV